MFCQLKSSSHTQKKDEKKLNKKKYLNYKSLEKFENYKRNNKRNDKGSVGVS